MGRRRCCHLLALLCAGCGVRLVALRPDYVPPLGPSPHGLRVVPIVEDGADPVRLKGSDIAFAGATAALADIITIATTSWAERHRAQRPEGWELRVALVQSKAEICGKRITVELSTRVTLSATLGQAYLAQTHGYCKQTDTLASDPAATVHACMSSMAHDLSGWLEGVSP